MYFSTFILQDFLEYALLKGHGKERISTLLDVAKQRDSKYISYKELANSFDQFSNELNEENLGLNIGQQLSLKVTAYVDSIMEYSDTLEEAFDNAIEYSKLISDALDCSFEKQSDQYVLYFDESPDWSLQSKQIRRHILDLSFISALNSIVAYTNRSYFPISVSYTYQKPKYINAYYEVLNCSLKFSQKRNCIVFEKKIFDQSRKSIDFGLLENLKQKIKNEITALKSEPTLVRHVKACILNAKPKRIDIVHVSKALNISKRSLQRHLKENKTSFRVIEQSIQLKLAENYIFENDKSMDEISYLLGFSESSAFIRFFKKNKGVSPHKFRSKSRHSQL